MFHRAIRNGKSSCRVSEPFTRRAVACWVSWSHRIVAGQRLVVVDLAVLALGWARPSWPTGKPCRESAYISCRPARPRWPVPAPDFPDTSGTAAMKSARCSRVSLGLFRVLQESLHNSAKHSGVKHFEVRVWGTLDEIHLTVKDSGAGFEREAAKESRGLGLITMEERVKLLKGTLSIESQPKRGTTIHACVPLRSGSDSARAAG